MGAAANQLHENETKGSLIDLYLKSLDENRELGSAVKAADDFIEGLAVCSQLTTALGRCEPCRMKRHHYMEIRERQKKAKG